MKKFGYLNIKNWVKLHPLWCVFIALVFLWWVTRYYPWFYTGPSIEGYVQDEMTREPVVGAVAVLQFTVRKSLLHGTKDKTIYLAESVTDENGRYFFDKWGPILNPFLHSPESNRTPTIGVYKLGYKMSGIHNASKAPKGFKLRFQASENIVILKKFESLDAEVERWLKTHQSGIIWSVGRGMKCAWQKIPNFTIEDDKRLRLYREHLPSEYHRKMPRLIAEWTFWKEQGCLDPKSFFKDYLSSLN